VRQDTLVSAASDGALGRGVACVVQAAVDAAEAMDAAVSVTIMTMNDLLARATFSLALADDEIDPYAAWELCVRLWLLCDHATFHDLLRRGPADVPQRTAGA
jgi:hypothetical protein